MAVSTQNPGCGACRDAREYSQAESDAVREPLANAENRPESEAVAGSEKYSVSDGARERAQRSVFAAEQIVGQIQRSEHVERAADDADHRQRVLVDSHGEAS